MTNQTLFLVLTFLRMKSWRLILLFPVLAFCLFGIKLGYKLSDGLVAKPKPDVYGLDAVNANDLTSTASSYFMGSASASSKQIAAVAKILTTFNGSATFPNRYVQCSIGDPCFSKIYSSMLTKDDNRGYYVDYDQEMVICQLAPSSGLQKCLLMWNTVALSHSVTAVQKLWYRQLHIFQLVHPPTHPVSTTAAADCNGDKAFFTRLPTILTFEMILLSALVSSYLLVGTVASICELKSRGFLQLLVRKGLSPLSFWAAVWLPTTVELLLLAASLAASFYLHCARLFSIKQLVLISLIASLHLFSLTAFVMLLTVLTNDFYTICKGILFGTTVYGSASVLGNQLAHELAASGYLKATLLTAPLVNTAELSEAILMGQIIPGAITSKHWVGVATNAATLLVLCLVTLYLDHVLPTGNGLCYPASFLCQLAAATSATDESMPQMSKASSPRVEMLDLSVFIRLLDVRHEGASITDRSSNTPGAGLSVDIYDDQITAVVDCDGPASGGLLSVLTGRLPVSSGQVWVNGRLASNPMARLCRHIHVGECPPNNALSHSLTVAQSLRACLVARGLAWQQCEQELNDALTLLRLLDKLPCRVGDLSSGQRRKLCVALALLGNPRLLVLNDPARGLDPQSRRRLWRLLQRCQSGRCTVLSSQFADEADAFADRKIFLSAGNSVVCAGSSAYIRRILSCDMMIVHVKFSDEDAMKKLHSELALQVTTHVRCSLLTVEVPLREEHVLHSLVDSLKTVEEHISWVKLNSAPLSELCSETMKAAAPSSQNNEADSAAIIPNEEAISEQNTRAEKSKASCCGATGGILCLYCSLLRRNCWQTVAGIAIPLFFLIIHVLMLLLEKKVLSSREALWTDISSLAAEDFSSGFCITDKEIPARHQIDNNGCRVFFAGGAMTGNNNFLVLKKPLAVKLYDYMQQPAILRKLQKHHKQSGPHKLPCPVVYSNTWSISTTSKLRSTREVSIGSYNSHEEHLPDLSAATALKVSQRALTYFFGSTVSVNFNLIAAFAPSKTGLLPLYGSFYQILLLTILPTWYLSDIMKHKKSKWIDYLATMGVSKMGYWTSTFVFHWLQYAAIYGVMTVASFLANPLVYEYKKGYQLAVVGATVTLGLFNNLALAYVIGSVFARSKRLATAMHLVLSLVTGASLIVATKSANFAITAARAALPPFTLGSLMLDTMQLNVYATQFNKEVQKIEQVLPKLRPQQYLWDTVNYSIAMPLQTVALVALLIVIENAPILRECCCSPSEKESSVDGGPIADQEVARQEDSHRSPIVESQCRGILECSNVTKTYSGDVKAVRQLNLSVAAGETVVLFGPNGSGVSTTLDAITGRQLASSGQCRINSANRWMSGRRAVASGAVAYSPQSNPLFGALTTEEHMRHYAQMLGASGDMVQRLMQDTNLEGVKSTPVRQLSECHRRRLSVAVALLSSSPLLIADDVSSGIAPGEQQNIWQAIARRSDDRLAVILSAHSLTGVENLKARLVLINRGFVVDAGTVPQLVKRHGSYVIEIAFEAQTAELACEKKAKFLKFLVRGFFSLEILDQSLTWMKLAIPLQGEEPPLSSFSRLLKLKKQHSDIIDVKFYPADMDQVAGSAIKHHDETVQSGANPAEASLAPMAEYFAAV